CALPISNSTPNRTDATANSNNRRTPTRSCIESAPTEGVTVLVGEPQHLDRQQPRQGAVSLLSGLLDLSCHLLEPRGCFFINYEHVTPPLHSAAETGRNRTVTRALSTPRSGAAATHKRGTLRRVSAHGLT